MAMFNAGVNMSEILVKGNGPHPLSVSIELSQDIKDLDQLKLHNAAQHMADALSSEEFKQFCLDYKFNIKYYKRRWFRRYVYKTREYLGFRKTEGSSPMQVYNHLMSGAERLNPEEDNEASIKMRIDYKYSRGVIGYTYPNTMTQWIYYNFFRRYNYKSIAGNVSHEWCHKMKYGHSFRYNSLRGHTVPYAVGNFVRKFGQEKS